MVEDRSPGHTSIVGFPDASIGGSGVDHHRITWLANNGSNPISPWSDLAIMQLSKRIAICGLILSEMHLAGWSLGESTDGQTKNDSQACDRTHNGNIALIAHRF